MFTFDGDFPPKWNIPPPRKHRVAKLEDSLANSAKVAKAAFTHFCGFTKLQSSIFQFFDAMFAGRWDTCIPFWWIKSPSKVESAQSTDVLILHSYIHMSCVQMVYSRSMHMIHVAIIQNLLQPKQAIGFTLSEHRWRRFCNKILFTSLQQNHILFMICPP